MGGICEAEAANGQIGQDHMMPVIISMRTKDGEIEGGNKGESHTFNTVC